MKQKHWLVLGLKDKKLAKKPEVKKWLDETRNILEALFLARYIDMGTYGTSIMEIKSETKTA